MKSEPQKEHHWLQRLVGEWTYEMDSADPQHGKFSGTESVRSLGGLWVIAEGKGTTPDGQPATMILTLGFDPLKGGFTGTWVGSMMNTLWVYKGTWDEAANRLTLDTEGPNFTPGATGLSNYRE